MSHTESLIISVIIMGVGFIGLFIPFLPGIPLIYAGYIFYGMATGWIDYGWVAMVVWGVVVAALSFIDFYSGSLGAKKYGASRYAVWGAIAGGIIGLFAGGFIGVIVGPVVGAIIGELIAGKSWNEALRAGKGTAIGFVIGSFLKIAVAVAMIGTFLVWTL